MRESEREREEKERVRVLAGTNKQTDQPTNQFNTTPNHRKRVHACLHDGGHTRGIELPQPRPEARFPDKGLVGHAVVQGAGGEEEGRGVLVVAWGVLLVGGEGPGHGLVLGP